MSSGLSFKVKTSSSGAIKNVGKSKISDILKDEKGDCKNGSRGEKVDYISDSRDLNRKPKNEEGPLVIKSRPNSIPSPFQPSGGGGESKEGEEKKKKESDEIVAEILDDARKELENWRDEISETKKSKNGGNSDLSIAVMADKEKTGNVQKNDEVSKLEDYEDVPVEDYGLAMLRGMGWKPGKGIGGFKSRVIEHSEPVARPKGLGLGANVSKKASEEAKNASKDSKEPLIIKKGAYVCVTSGTHKDNYGVIEGMDDLSARVFVKLALTSKVENLSENAVKLVTKSEYKENSKVINKDMYDKYKEKQKNREKEWRKKDDRSGEESRKRSRSRSLSPAVKRRSNWVRRHLRVRYVNENYKKGRYYNTKMNVVDVLTPEVVICKAETDGAILDNVHPDDLETIIPKQSDGVIMILTGKEKGELGSLVKKDKRNCEAYVQLLDRKDKVLKLDFDDVCEYIGDITDY